MSDTNTDSDYSYYSDDEYYENEYEPEEQSLTKYNIVLCDSLLYNYHLVLIRFKQFKYNQICSVYNEVFTEMYRKIEIAECIYLPSQECIGIIKTFWIKLIQRRWKNLLKERKIIIKKRCNPNSLKYIEINGKWPINCCYYPVLKGMLSNLSKTSF